jgi:uncharacterized protein YegL
MPNQNLTEFYFIIDRSGSMSGEKAREVISGFNNFMEDQQKEAGEAVVTVVIFDSNEPFKVIANRRGLDFRLNSNNYSPRGMTPLYQACIQGIDKLGNLLVATPEEQRPGKIVFVIMTDGLENTSGVGYTKTALAAKIQHQESKYGWNFLFLGQDIDAKVEGAKAGFSPATTAQTSSFEKALKVTSDNVRSYRSSGNAERLIYSDADKAVM